jgi:hypothetical protein
MTLAAIVQVSGSTTKEAPSLFAMAACYMVLAVIGIFWPEIIRNGLTRMRVAQRRGWLADDASLKPMRWILGAIGIAGASLFAYMAFRSLAQQ